MPEKPATRDLIEAWGAPGPLHEQPAVQRLLEVREIERLEAQWNLTLGGDDAD